MSGIVLSGEDLAALTGYAQPARQLDEIHRQGFFRARIGRKRSVG